MDLGLQDSLGPNPCETRRLYLHLLCRGTYSAGALTLPGHLLCRGTYSAGALTLYIVLSISSLWLVSGWELTDFMLSQSGGGAHTSLGANVYANVVNWE